MRHRRRPTHQKAPVEQLVTVAVVGQVSEVLEGPRLVLKMAGDRLGHGGHASILSRHRIPGAVVHRSD